MRWFILFLATFAASQSFAANALVRDGGTIDLGGVTFRLDGIDAPALDQTCIDDHADSWACGVDARDQLTSLIDDREVHCDDLGPDKTYKKWHLGVCTTEGETETKTRLEVFVREFDGFGCRRTRNKLLKAGTISRAPKYRLSL